MILTSLTGTGTCVSIILGTAGAAVTEASYFFAFEGISNVPKVSSLVGFFVIAIVGFLVLSKFLATA